MLYIIDGREVDVNAGEEGLDSNGDIIINRGKIIVYEASKGAHQSI